MLEKAGIDGAALEAIEIRDLLDVVERVAAWRNSSILRLAVRATTGRESPASPRRCWTMTLLRCCVMLRGKIEPDGSLNDDASPELRRIRRAMERQHRAIEESLRK